jgi:hypothetical protein
MFAISIGWRRSWLLVLAGCVLVSTSAAPARDEGRSLKGGTRKVDDAKVCTLKLSARTLLPCMLWADKKGSAFLAVEGSTGLLRRISFPDFKVIKEKDLERKFTWPQIDMRFAIAGNTADNTAGITFSPNSKWLCLVKPWGNVRDRRNATAVYRVDSFERHCILEHADGRRPPIGEPPLAVGFDLKGGYVYTQNNDRKLMVCTLHGVTKKEYRFDGGANKPVLQFLVHPDGNQVVLLTRQAVYFIEVPGKKTGTTGSAIEDPKKK